MQLLSSIKYYIRQLPLIYPLRIINSAKDWIDSGNKKSAEFGGVRSHWYKVMEDEEFHNNEAPQTYGTPNKNKFDYNTSYKTAEATLFQLKNAFVYRHKGLIFTHNHHLLKEFSHHFYIAPMRKFIFKHPFYTFSPGYRRVNAVGASLLSSESHNYYHWLFDVLPKLRLYQEVAAHIDYYIVADNVPDKFLAVLTEFGIRPEQVLRIGDKEKLQFEHLYVTSVIGSEGRSPRWAMNFLRKKLNNYIVPGHSGAKRIYLSRGNGPRKILNEAAVIDALRKLDFQIVDPGNLSIAEQVNLMHNAEIVVGTHGASLSNLLFCNEGCKVVELFSPDYFRTDCYYTLAAQLGLAYWYVTGEKQHGKEWGDMVIPADTLTKTVTHLINA